MVDPLDIILVSTNRFLEDPAEEDGGISLISHILREKGLSPKAIFIGDYDPKKIPENAIVGFGSHYESLDRILKTASLAHESNFVVLGGSATFYKDVNKELLETGLIDAVNYKHTQPFIDFVTSINGQRSKEDLLALAQEKGLATLGKPFVKAGKFPSLENLSLQLVTKNDEEGKSTVLIVPPTHACVHACDYCTQNFFAFPDLVPQIVELAEKYQREGGSISRVEFRSSFLDEKSVSDARRILPVIKGNPDTSFYVDSSQLVPDLYDETVSLLNEFNSDRTFIGLNAINASTAKYVGRNLNGKPRSEEQITAEKEGIIRLMKEDRSKHLSNPAQYVVSVMVSPGDDEESISDLLSFTVKMMHKCLQYKTIARIQLPQVVPFPGSKFSRRNGQDYHMKKYSDYEITPIFRPDLFAKNNESQDLTAKFLSHAVIASYFLAKGSTDLLLGTQALFMAYEHVFEGKSKFNDFLLFSDMENFVNLVKKDLFPKVLQPEKVSFLYE